MLIYDTITVITWNATRVGHSSGSDDMSTPQSE